MRNTIFITIIILSLYSSTLLAKLNLPVRPGAQEIYNAENCANPDYVGRNPSQCNRSAGSRSEMQSSNESDNSRQCFKGYEYIRFFSDTTTADKFSQENPPSKCFINGVSNGYIACCRVGAEIVDRIDEKPEADSKALTPEQKATCDEAVQLVQKCEHDYTAAESECNPEKGELGSFTKNLEMANPMAAMGMAAGQMMGVNALCEKVAGMMSGLNAALAGFKVSCEYSRSSCVSTCNDVVTKSKNCPSTGDYSSLADSSGDSQKNARSCHALHSRVSDATQSAGMALTSFAQAKQCEAITKMMNTPLCQKNPFAPGCVARNQTCDDPAFAASNQVCLCQKYPNDPSKCKDASPQQAQVNLPTGTGAPLLKPGNLGGPGGENQGNADTSLLGGPDAGKLAAGDGEEVGGKKGSGAPLNPNAGTGSGNGGSGRAGGGVSIDRDGQSIYSGNYGSGSGGAGLAGARGNYSGNSGNRGPTATSGVLQNKFNPGMMGMSTPSGLTGPNGLSIWQKVSNRYQAKTNTLKKQ